MELLLDVDGVLADYTGHLCYKYLPNRHPREFTTFNLSMHLTWEETQMWERARVEEGFCKSIPWYPGAHEFLCDLQARFNELMIVTARDTRAPHWVGERDAWLFAEGIKHNQIIYCPTDKKYLVSGDILIEDNVTTCNAWAARHTRGHALLIERPHNAGYPVVEGVVRVKAYQDAIDFLDSLASIKSENVGPASTLRSI